MPGEEAAIDVTVTPEMTARLFGRQMNPLYGTVSMVLHVEESGRTIVDRHLGPDEDAVGYRIEVTHEAPARVGEVIRVTARVVHADERECVTEHQVLGPAGVVGRARFVQRYVRRGALLGGSGGSSPAERSGADQAAALPGGGDPPEAGRRRVQDGGTGAG